MNADQADLFGNRPATDGTRPLSGRRRQEAGATSPVPAEPDLFSPHTADGPGDGRRFRVQNPPDMSGLSDEEVLRRIHPANMKDVRPLCEQVVARSLTAAVPELEKLWHRFRGTDHRAPLLEHRAVMETLIRLDCLEARQAMTRLLQRGNLPEPMRPTALLGAAALSVRAPAELVSSFLGCDDANLRKAAYSLAGAAGIPGELLLDGLGDPVPEIRQSAALTLAALGFREGRNRLLQILKTSPSMEIIEALAAVWDQDDDIIVHLARCGRAHPELADEIRDILKEIGDPKAGGLARMLEIGDRGS